MTLPVARWRKSFGAVLLGGSLAFATVVGCSGGTGPGEVPVTSATELVADGKSVYLQRCVGCHGVDGSGIVGPDIRPDEVLEKYASAEAMEALVRGGLGEMPEFTSKLSDDEIAAVVAYVRGGLG